MEVMGGKVVRGRKPPASAGGTTAAQVLHTCSMFIMRAVRVLHVCMRVRVCVRACVRACVRGVCVRVCVRFPCVCVPGRTWTTFKWRGYGTWLRATQPNAPVSVHEACTYTRGPSVREVAGHLLRP